MGFFDRVKDALTRSDDEKAKKTQAEHTEAEPQRAAAQEQPATKEQAQADAPATKEPTQADPPATTEDVGTDRKEGGYRTYTVRSGDTLPGIAEEHGVDAHELAALNKLDNPDLIYPGQVVRVPNG